MPSLLMFVLEFHLFFFDTENIEGGNNQVESDKVQVYVKTRPELAAHGLCCWDFQEEAGW